MVAATGVQGIDPQPERDRSLFDRELSGLAGMSPHAHGKATPQLLNRRGRDRHRYIYQQPDLSLDAPLLR